MEAKEGIAHADNHDEQKRESPLFVRLFGPLLITPAQSHFPATCTPAIIIDFGSDTQTRGLDNGHSTRNAL